MKDLRYFIVYFSHDVVKKWALTPNENIDLVIKDYLQKQNAGETKSGRLRLLDKKKVQKET